MESLTIDELAARWKLHHNTVRRMVKKWHETDGVEGIEAHMFCGKWMIKLEHIEVFERNGWVK
jgi:transposase